jgi:ArsR family transcriptional regulator, lead/cadmium/zinc/bismuth-responsive transcriptional repressor
VPEPVDIDSCDVKLVDPERVRAVQASLPTSDVMQELADVFGLLGDPNRLRLLAILLEGGELCVCDLAAAAGMAESTTSHALRLLRAHQVVKVRRAGRMMHYSLRDGHVRMLLDVALEHVAHSDGRGPAVAR